jgi:transcriptional regulator with XRE-family HTH domain
MPRKTLKIPRPYTNVGEHLKQKREALELTQREVSNALGYSSAQFISNFERGIAVPPIKKLKVLTKLYKMQADPVIDLILDGYRGEMEKALKASA